MAVADVTVSSEGVPPIIIENTLTDDDCHRDSTTTITSTTSNSLFGGFLINRRFHQQLHQQQQPNHRKSSSKSPARMASFSKNLKHVARVSSRNINSLARSKLYNSFPNLNRKENLNQNVYSIDDENVKKVLKAVESDHVVLTNVADNRNRRTVFIEKSSGMGKFGFTMQSYTFRHLKTNKIEQITYVDYVDLDSPAFVAGLRAGDIILSINGRNVQNETHQQLVNYIGQCKSVRMVVLFENCVNRIELCARAIKLKKLLADKEFELRVLRCQEDRIISGMPPYTDLEILALLRTPCNTPRSVSFALPNKKNDDDDSTGSTNYIVRRPSAPIQSTTNVYYVNEEDDTKQVDDDDDVNSIIHYMDVDETETPNALDVEEVRIDRLMTNTRTSIDDTTSVVEDPLSTMTKMANFIVGGSCTSSEAGMQSSSRQSSFRRSMASSTFSGEDNEELHSSKGVVSVVSGHHSAEEEGGDDDLALIHILHIDDSEYVPPAPPQQYRCNELPPAAVAVTRF